MNFSKTTEYALRVLSYMVMDQDKLYSANEIFEALQIPYRYLRKQLTNLSKSDFIESVQGVNGGYRLKKSPDKISLLDIVNACGENISEIRCFFGFESCTLSEQCVMHDKWVSVNSHILQTLSSTTLANIREECLANINKNSTN
jgi:Rrf2 family protein